MTLLIAHRGLLDGPDTDKENTLSALLAARQQGFDVEIDVWYHNFSWWLGHDAPTEQISLEWLRIIDGVDVSNSHHAWIHAKSIQTLYQLHAVHWSGHMFFHENDPVTLTNSGYLWTYPGCDLTPHSICVLPENTDAITRCHTLNVFAFCTDYVHTIANRLS